MSKPVHALALLCLLMLIILSIAAPNSPIMYLASASSQINIVRILLSMLLVVEILTNPPRSKIWRIVVALFALFICGWAALQTYQDNMQLLDGLSLAAASISMLISAMELRFDMPEVDVEQLRSAKTGILMDNYALRGGHS